MRVIGSSRVGVSLPRMRGTLLVGAAFALLAAACGQTAPARSALPDVPAEFDFPPPTTTLVPADGTCVVTTGNGVSISEVSPTYDAARVLHPGDVIVAVDGVAVTNQSSLLAAMAGRVPGSELDVTVNRDGTATTETLVLGSAPDDESRAMIGVIVYDSFDTVTTDEIEPGIIESGRLLVSFDDGLYAVDILTNEWVALPFAVPPSAIVEIEELFIAVADDRLGVVAIDGTRRYDLSVDDFFVITPLGALGSSLVYSVAQSDEAGGTASSGVVTADFVNNRIEWSRQPPAVDGEYPVPVAGFVRPDEQAIAVTHRAGDVRVHTLYGADGSVLAGWGSEGPEIAPQSSLVAGWLDGQRLVSISQAEDGAFVATIARPDDPDETETFPLTGVSDVSSVATVAGTDLLIVTSSTQTLVFDLAASTFATVTRNCGMVVLGRAG